MARRRRWAGVSPRPAGAVGTMDGMSSSPSRRKTSSTKSAGMVRSVRHVGGVTSNLAPQEDTSTVQPISSSRSMTVSREYSTPAMSPGKDAAMRMLGRLGTSPTMVRSAEIVPPAILTSSDAAISSATSTIAGSTPRSKRREASELSLWRREVRATVMGSQVAASK